jgi:hypothetical protein
MVRKHWFRCSLALALGSVVGDVRATTRPAIVDFRNNQEFATTADRRVYDPFGAPLVGTNWGAQLFYGADASNLIPVTNPPAPFRMPSTSVPGTWIGGARILTGFVEGQTLTLQVRVWDRLMFPRFEDAMAAGGAFGVSQPFSYTAPISDPVPPPVQAFAMENLRAFSVNSPVPPTNRPPTGTLQNVSTPEDTPLNITLAGSDPDNDPITFSLPATQSAQGGTLTLAGAMVLYKPPENFFGNDQFDFVVSDRRATASATVRINVTSVNDPPTAIAQVGPLLRLTADQTNLLILSINGSNAAVVLDASQSSDVDTTALGFIWSTREPPALLGRGEVITNVFGVGSHIVHLEARDGMATDTTSVTFDVITLSDAVALLTGLVSDAALGRSQQRPLLTTLKAASRAFESGDAEAGLQQLEVFAQKIERQVAPTNPDSAAMLLAAVQGILTAWEAQETL